MIGARKQHGFSLIELAVVLVIIGLVVGGGIAAVSATNEQVRRAEQKRIFSHVRAALYGFAMDEGRLPCPDSDDADGAEDLDGNSPFGCAETQGQPPWADLGVGRRDAWGNPMLYRVDSDFADEPPASGTATFALDQDGNLRVEDGDGINIAQDVPAVLVSFGPQGRQVWTSGGFVCPGDDGAPASGFSAHETANCDDTNDFVDAGYRPADSGDGRFDDLLTWIPLTVLKNRMVDAGKLP